MDVSPLALKKRGGGVHRLVNNSLMTTTERASTADVKDKISSRFIIKLGEKFGQDP